MIHDIIGLNCRFNQNWVVELVVGLAAVLENV